MEEDRPPDVRDSLSELERRLLELERELRADSTRDRGPDPSTRIPVPRPPYGGPRPLVEDEPPPVPAGSPQIDALMHETQRRVDGLRECLDGLTHASDRMREVAQVVVEEHGRALVRLERATGQPWARAAVADAGTGDDATGLDWVDDEAPATPRREPVAQAAAEAPFEAGVDDEREPVARPAETPLDSGVADATAREARPGIITPGTARVARRRRRRWRWPWLAFGPLLVAAGVATAIVLYGEDNGQVATPTTVPGAESRIALAGELGDDAAAFDSVPGARAASDIGAAADLCDEVVGAAVRLRKSSEPETPPCEDVVVVSDGSLSATALAERAGKGERTCLNVENVATTAASRPDRALTAARKREVERAISRASARTKGAGLTNAERAGALHTAAYQAGRRFDERRGLRLLAVRAQTGAPCVIPGRDDIASGRYPLADRIELLAKESARERPAVVRAAVVIDNLTSGPAPINVTVLRPRR